VYAVCGLPVKKEPCTSEGKKSVKKGKTLTNLESSGQYQQLGVRNHNSSQHAAGGNGKLNVCSRLGAQWAIHIRQLLGWNIVNDHQLGPNCPCNGNRTIKNIASTSIEPLKPMLWSFSFEAVARTRRATRSVVSIT
jgi:hypothetical protein